MWQLISIVLLLTSTNIVKSAILDYCDTSSKCVCTLKLETDNVPGLHVDCSYQRLLSQQLSSVRSDAVILDLSWNSLSSIPSIVPENQLEVLNLMHNNISALKSNEFQYYKLKKLYLNWNSIQSIEKQAFTELTTLTVLDLSHNNIQTLPTQIFSTINRLSVLALSWNRELKLNNENTLDFYQNFGINWNLTYLSLEACGLNAIALPRNVSLHVLDLSENQLIKIPQLPANIEKLDLSGNLFREIPVAAFDQVKNLTELLLEDLPQLESVRAFSLVDMKSLRKLSFQNCRRLTYFDTNTFGDSSQKPPLTELTFRGTALRTLNGTGSLFEVMSSLQKLDIYGMPLQCDCHLIWITELNGVQINGLCMEPSSLRGRRIVDIPVSEFECHVWSEFGYNLTIFCLILFIVACILIAVKILRPYGGVTMRHKVGAGSPYAPVTIQPNNQENNYY